MNRNVGKAAADKVNPTGYRVIPGCLCIWPSLSTFLSRDNKQAPPAAIRE